MSAKVTGYQCSLTQQTYAPEEVQYVSPDSGANLDVLLDYEAIKRAVSPKDIRASGQHSMWRYLPLLPVDAPGHKNTPLHAVGWTPVYQPTELTRQTGVQQLFLKDESRNPTASFKDRASALLVARAAEIKAEVMVTASTGNAGAALAGLAAAVGQKAVIIAPQNAPPAKLAQLLVYGARVILVEGNYDDAFDLSIEASQEFGWYNRNTGYNPFTLEGKKTAAFEIWEQVLTKHDFVKPLCIFVSVGDGNIIAGIHKGFKDLHTLGWLEAMPRLFGVQSENAAAVYNAFASGSDEITPVHSTTIADSIGVDLPRDGLRALRAATQTQGAYIKVTDQAILGAVVELGKVGVFAEPAGGAAYAGVCQALADGLLEPDDPVLVVNTGSGLKDAQAARDVMGVASIIEPTLSALKKVIS